MVSETFFGSDEARTENGSIKRRLRRKRLKQKYSVAREGADNYEFKSSTLV